MKKLRYMREILFFDLPTETSAQRKSYRDFMKVLTSLGFFMLQESVYTKLCTNSKGKNAVLKSIKSSLPSKGNILMLTVTEQEFLNMEILLGKLSDGYIEKSDAIIEL